MGPVHIRAYMGPVHIGRRVLLIPSLLPGSLTEQQTSIIIVITITILAIHQFEIYFHRNEKHTIPVQPLNTDLVVAHEPIFSGIGTLETKVSGNILHPLSLQKPKLLPRNRL